jgi:hypothetical protein
MSAFYMVARTDSITARAVRALGAWLGAAALTLLMTWPLAAGISHLGRTQNSGDARFAVWNVAWVAHALTTDPAGVFNANIFYPHRRTLAFSEANLGAGALAAPIWWLTKNPNTSHNIVVLFAFTASVLCAWLLARRLTNDSAAAAVAGIVYAFCPYLFSHTAHIQLLMAPGIPLAMLMFHKLVDAPSLGRGTTLGLALAATALSCAYYGIFAGLAIGYATLLYAWTRRLWRSPPYWIAVAAGAAVSIALVVPFFLPYLEIQRETGFARSLDDARMYSATWKSYLASGAWPHRWMLGHLGSWSNEVLFPGFVATVLGIAGFFVAINDYDTSKPLTGSGRETAWLYGSLAVLVFWASLGPQAGLYTLFYRTIPVFSFLRAPGRMGIVVMLALAIFTAFAVRALRQRVPPRAAGAIAAIACLAALIDLRQAPFDWRTDDTPPESYRVLAQLPRGSVAEFPFFHRRIDFHLHTRYMLNSTTHWQPLVNGYSDHIPIDFRTLATRLASFPSRDSFKALRERRVRYITVHRNKYGQRRARDVEAGLRAYGDALKLIAEDRRMAIYEVVTWPE